MKGSWKFDLDLAYEHKTERYKGHSSGPSPFFQSSSSRPIAEIARGIWAPPDLLAEHLDLFRTSESGFARILKLEWIDSANYDYHACLLDGERFGRE